jgi:hypothetical protein
MNAARLAYFGATSPNLVDNEEAVRVFYIQDDSGGSEPALTGFVVNEQCAVQVESRSQQAPVQPVLPLNTAGPIIPGGVQPWK